VKLWEPPDEELQPGRVNVPTRVCQLAELVVVRYSVVYQKVQSSAGSISIED